MDGGLNTGELKGSYRLLRMIGSGGMGVVYEAWDTRLDRRVALKLLHPHLLADPARQRGFEREARIAARVEHPNVVRVYRIDHIDGQSAIEMQYIAGQPLSAVLRSGRLTPGQAIDVLEQLFGSLACCHEQGLVHCDIKPGNLLVTPEGQVYLTDFGIARALSMPDADNTSAPMDPPSGPLWGTPRYSPPEAWEGGVPTPQWDLYAAGVLFYELLTGEPLFQSQMPATLMREILNDKPPSLAAALPNLPPDLVNLVEALVAKDPALRPGSARVVLERLATYPKGPDDTLMLAVQREASTVPFSINKTTTPLSADFYPAPRRRLVAPLMGLAALGVAILIVSYIFWPVSFSRFSGSAGDVPKDHLLATPWGTVFFSATDKTHGRELWAYSVETRKGQMVADLCPGPASSNPWRLFSRTNGDIVYSATTAENGDELWFCPSGSDGNYSTRLIKDIIPGPMGSEPEPIVAHENLVYFYATTLSAGRELWCTNASEAQTAMVADLFPGPQGSYANGARVTADDQGFYFVAFADAAKGAVLFRLDYASGIPREVADVNDDTAAMVVYKGSLFFTQKDDSHGAELWVHDPVANTTHLMIDIYPGTSSAAPGQFFVWKDRLFFQAKTEKYGQELWVTDGSAIGTTLVADLNPGPEGSDPYGFVDDGDYFYFRAGDDAHGREPWVSDGTAGGTHILADILPGRQGSSPYNMVSRGGGLLFSADDGVHGEELWSAMHVGTNWECALVEDLMPGPEKSEPHDLRLMSSVKALFVATLPERGRALLTLESGGGNNYIVQPVLFLQQP